MASEAEIVAALDAAAPGDVITIAPGGYAPGKLRIVRGGTAERPIILRAARLGDVVLWSREAVFIKVNAPHWRFENLLIDGICDTHQACEHAFQIVGGAHRTVLRGNRITNFNAAIKGNSEAYEGVQTWPNDVLVAENQIYNDSRRDVRSPTHGIDVVGGRRWILRDNFIADIARVDDAATYAGYLKGNSRDGVIERNLVICEWRHKGGNRVGLSLGGGGSGPANICEDHDCSVEHRGGVIRNNIVLQCPDVGLYLNEASDATVANNTLVATLGIQVDFDSTSAEIRNNIADGRIWSRNGAYYTAEDNHLTMQWFVDWLWKTAAEDIFADPGQGDFTVRRSDIVAGKAGRLLQVDDDFCGRPRADGSVDLGAIEYGQASCDVARRIPQTLSGRGVDLARDCAAGNGACGATAASPRP